MEGREAPYHSSQDQRKIPFPLELSGSHLPAIAGVGTRERSILRPWEDENRTCRRCSRCLMLRSEEELRTTRLDLHH